MPARASEAGSGTADVVVTEVIVTVPVASGTVIPALFPAVDAPPAPGDVMVNDAGNGGKLGFELVPATKSVAKASDVRDGPGPTLAEKDVRSDSP
jgi:hypothetical protein